MLGYAVVFAVQDLEIKVITAVIFKCMSDYSPCIAFIMIYEAFYILEDENFWLTFLYYSCKLSEKGSASIFKPFSLAYHRKRLTRRSTDKNIDFVFERCSIKGMNIGVPALIVDVVVGKV